MEAVLGFTHTLPWAVWGGAHQGHLMPPGHRSGVFAGPRKAYSQNCWQSLRPGDKYPSCTLRKRWVGLSCRLHPRKGFWGVSHPVGTRSLQRVLLYLSPLEDFLFLRA